MLTLLPLSGRVTYPPGRTHRIVVFDWGLSGMAVVCKTAFLTTSRGSARASQAARGPSRYTRASRRGETTLRRSATLNSLAIPRSTRVRFAVGVCSRDTGAPAATLTGQPVNLAKGILFSAVLALGTALAFS